jgi:hypothetical protein
MVFVASGDLGSKLRAMRAWGADALRSLKNAPTPAQTAPVPHPTTSLVAEPNCIDSVDEACVMLLAPFADVVEENTIHVPTMPVSALPKPKPRVVYVPPKPKPAEVKPDQHEDTDAVPPMPPVTEEEIPLARLP